VPIQQPSAGFRYIIWVDPGDTDLADLLNLLPINVAETFADYGVRIES